MAILKTIDPNKPIKIIVKDGDKTKVVSAKNLGEITLKYPSGIKFETSNSANPVPNNEIWYTTTDGEIFNMPDPSTIMEGLEYEYTLISNTYKNGKGIMKFDQPVKKVGAEEIEGVDDDPIIKLYTFFGSSEESGESTIQSIQLPNSVTFIGLSSFGNCSNLTSITILDSVTTIGGGAFYGCSSLTSITIPNSVMTIGDSAFDGCTSLISINYNGTQEQWKSISKGDDWEYDIPQTCKVHCTDGDMNI